MSLRFEPRKWHACTEDNWQTCTQGVNCYSYALNNPSYYWAVPGLGFTVTKTQHFYDSFNKYFEGVSKDDFRRQLITGAENDGLIKTAKSEDRKGYYSVALFFPDSGDIHDFHWYRRDDDGTWSHKDGRHAPSNKDSEGKTIYDPQKAAKPSYPVFGGFFLVPRKGLALRRDFPLTPQTPPGF